VRRDLLFEYISEGILVFNQNDELIDINLQGRIWTDVDENATPPFSPQLIFKNWPDNKIDLNEETHPVFYQSFGEGAERKTLEVRSLPYTDSDENLSGRIVLLRDISDFYQIENKLRANQRLLESMLNASTALIYIKGLNGRYILGNKKWSENLGIPLTQALGKTDLDLFPKDTAIQLRANDLKVIQANEPFEFEETIINKENKEIFLSIKFPIHDTDGKLFATGGISNEITERINTEELLKLHSFALEAAANAIVITDQGGKIQWVNPAFTKLTGYTLEEVIGNNTRILKSGKTPNLLYQELWETITQGGVWQGELINRRKDGSHYFEELTITPMFGKNKEITHYIAIKQDITDRRESERELLKTHNELKLQYERIKSLQEKLHEQAVRDPLTGLFNRRYLQETLPREISRANREQNPVSVLMIDIDHFKSVNDTYGHHAGDLLLVALSEMLRSMTRESDVVCRYGGEEFVIVLPGATLEDTCSRAETFRHGFENLKISYEDNIISRTISIGVAAYPENGKEGDQLLMAADRAMYKAKDTGRNRIRFYD
jgi:diguanylate cyclase (GGDEF)-like protein/PAS domain S-box-containing protein